MQRKRMNIAARASSAQASMAPRVVYASHIYTAYFAKPCNLPNGFRATLCLPIQVGCTPAFAHVGGCYVGGEIIQTAASAVKVKAYFSPLTYS